MEASVVKVHLSHLRWALITRREVWLQSCKQWSLPFSRSKVPELFIEVPESTTVGSLKRTVLDAMTALLRGGLGVGLLFHGKRIQDNFPAECYLSQWQSWYSGINQEPSSPGQPSPPLCCEVPSVLLAFNSPKNCVNRW